MSALVFLAYMSLLVLGLVDNIRGPFFPEILNELQLTGSTGSLFFAVTSLMAFVGSWSSHFILRKLDSLFLMWISSLIFSLGFIAVANASGLVLLILACALFGLAFGGLNVAQNLMVVEGTSFRLRRRLLNGLHSMYGFAALVAPLSATMFRWLGFNWRQTFMILAILPFLLAVWAFTWRNKKHRHEKPEPAKSLSPIEWRLCLGLALVLSSYLWGELSVGTRMVLWLRQDLGFAPDQANFYQAAFFAGLLFGRVVLSFVHFPGVSNWWLLSTSTGLSGLLYLCGLAFDPRLVIFSGFTMAPFFPVLMDQVNELFRKKSAQAMGIVIGAGSLSMVFMHVVIGALTDWIGLTRALEVCAIAQLLACAGLLWLQRQSHYFLREEKAH